MDILFIEKLTVMAMIGVHEWEKKCFQKLIFDLELAYNNKQIINNTGMCFYLDYTKIKENIFDIVNKNKFSLIEEVAEIIAKTLIRNFCVNWVRITVSKPSAMRDAYNVGVRIIRRK